MEHKTTMLIMGPVWARWMFITTMMLATQQLSPASARVIGVCYGTNGDNLPSPNDVISLYKKSGITFIRLFEPKPEILEALRGSELSVCLGVRNEDLESLSSSQDAANAWVNTNIAPYKDDVVFGWVTLGNEVIPGAEAPYVAQAMNNTRNALVSIGLDKVSVTTAIGSMVLGTSYPPSAGAFSSEVTEVMTNVATLLNNFGAPLMINVYPYFAYTSDPAHISLDYAVYFNSSPPIIDGDLKYSNLFDAMVDAFNAALEKINLAGVTVAVSETGWPSAGNEPYTSVEYAKTYNTNLLNHVTGSKTPRRPEHLMDTFFFEMFNEDLKEAGAEQNFGFFYPNMQPVYPFW